MTSEFVRVNGTKLYFRAVGKGDPLLLLHGWTQSSAFWDPYIDELAESFRVYTLDLPGHGRSGTLSPDFSLRKASEDLEAFITQLNLANVKAIGLSYGGLLLLQIAARNPGLLESIVVIAVSDKFDGKERWKDQPAIEFKDLDKGFQEYLMKQHPFGPDQINALFNKNLDYSISLSPARLQKIQSKMLIIHGDRDEVAGIDGAMRMFKNVSGAALWVIPNTGHMAIHEENKKEFLKTVEQFLANS